MYAVDLPAPFGYTCFAIDVPSVRDGEPLRSDACAEAGLKPHIPLVASGHVHRPQIYMVTPVRPGYVP